MCKLTCCIHWIGVSGVSWPSCRIYSIATPCLTGSNKRGKTVQRSGRKIHCLDEPSPRFDVKIHHRLLVCLRYQMNHHQQTARSIRSQTGGRRGSSRHFEVPILKFAFLHTLRLRVVEVTGSIATRAHYTGRYWQPRPYRLQYQWTM